MRVVANVCGRVDRCAYSCEGDTEGLPCLRSVRGYKYQTLGPTDDSGNNTGGRYLLTGSAEVDYLFWKKWGLSLIHI